VVERKTENLYGLVQFYPQAWGYSVMASTAVFKIAIIGSSPIIFDLMLEYNSIKIKYLRSLLTSKILQPFKDPKAFNLFFLGRNKHRAQILFLFIILSLIIDKKLNMCLKHKKNRQKPKFLGFRVFLNNFYIFKFIVMHLAVLDVVKLSSRKSNKAEASIIFKEFPIVYEIDRLCEQHNSIIEHIKNYTIIINTKLDLESNFDWFYIECYIRLFKIPYINKTRSLIQ
jgi:hypothetical protein